ncbi:MAG: hypothetical protein ACKVVP_08055 [Chloroflexota bacterium]
MSNCKVKLARLAASIAFLLQVSSASAPLPAVQAAQSMHSSEVEPSDRPLFARSASAEARRQAKRARRAAAKGQGTTLQNPGGDSPGPVGRAGAAQAITLPPRTPEPPTPSAQQRQRLEDSLSRSYLPSAPLVDEPNAPRRSGRPLAPETEVAPASGPAPHAPNDLTMFRSTALSSTAFNGSKSTTGEPSVAMSGNVVFMTGNWYAAVSADGGQSFTFINPNIAFPDPPGNFFCCDQEVIYDSSRDLFIWLLQYSTATDVNNVQRIAIAHGAAGVLANQWVFFDVASANTAFGAGFFLDYPHVALSNNFFYYTTNVFTGAGSGTGTMILRFSLTELNALTQGAGPTFEQFRNTTSSLTYTPVQGATTTMYFARINSSTTRPVFIWPENQPAAGITSFTATHSLALTTAPYSCPGPDGFNWCNRMDSRTSGGWVAGGVIGFLWNAAQGTGGLGTFPFPYVHVIRINQATQALIDEPIIFNGSHAFGYGHVGVNARGHLGMNIAWGGGAFHPSSAFLLRDDITPSAWAFANVRSGTNGPGTNRWGDYFRSRPLGNAWIGGTFTLQGPCTNPGSSQCNNVEPRFVVVGRERDNPFAPSCPSPRPDLGRAVAPIGPGRVRVDVTAGFGALVNVTATKLVNAQVEVAGVVLTAPGQVATINASAIGMFVQRTVGAGAFHAELTFVDSCGAYPLFFGQGS